jgi:hypothetical protein
MAQPISRGVEITVDGVGVEALRRDEGAAVDDDGEPVLQQAQLEEGAGLGEALQLGQVPRRQRRRQRRHRELGPLAEEARHRDVDIAVDA